MKIQEIVDISNEVAYLSRKVGHEGCDEARKELASYETRLEEIEAQLCVKPSSARREFHLLYLMVALSPIERDVESVRTRMGWLLKTYTKVNQ